jgi:hypothetical protein
VVHGRVIAVLAGVTALAVAPLAHAQNGFPDYRQAVADQYPTQPPPGNTGSGSGGGGAGEQTGGSSGKPRPVHHGSTGAGQHRGGALSPSSTGGNSPVAVPTKPVPAAKGSLPFTGSDLSGLVVLALVLIAAGLFVGAVARATRRRRRHAPA